MPTQNSPVIAVRKGERFKLWVGSVPRHRPVSGRGSENAKVKSGVITERCIFKCKGRLYQCKFIWHTGGDKRREIWLVAKQSDYDEVAFSVPEVVLF